MMESHIHSLNALFEQLGLPSSDDEIQAFIQAHQAITPATCLSGADFWTPSQAAFLAEAIAEDADWSRVVDELDVRLRS
jgi:uncharacterized protein involved in type VI secretion and phage assembly